MVSSLNSRGGVTGGNCTAYARQNLFEGTMLGPTAHGAVPIVNSTVGRFCVESYHTKQGQAPMRLRLSRCGERHPGCCRHLPHESGQGCRDGAR
jgi:hypothetical protein